MTCLGAEWRLIAFSFGLHTSKVYGSEDRETKEKSIFTENLCRQVSIHKKSHNNSSVVCCEFSTAMTFEFRVICFESNLLEIQLPFKSTLGEEMFGVKSSKCGLMYFFSSSLSGSRTDSQFDLHLISEKSTKINQNICGKRFFHSRESPKWKINRLISIFNYKFQPNGNINLKKHMHSACSQSTFHSWRNLPKIALFVFKLFQQTRAEQTEKRESCVAICISFAV